eukprot:414943_1
MVYHVSKYLNELICYYGINGDEDENKYEYGPFFSGVSCVLNIGSFAIRLNAPTSTSKQIAVASRFCNEKGIIIQLNNIANASAGGLERFMDCSWLSNYPEEDERLFIRGRYKLEIESIRLYDKINGTWKNYQRFFRTFYLFDSLLSGDWPADIQTPVTIKDVKILNHFILHALENKENNFDNYVNDAFYLFCQEKTQIILNLFEMFKYVKNEKFISIVMHSVLEQAKPRNTMDNLFKPELLRLFKNITEIIIYTTANTRIFSCNIINLLNMICEIPSKVNTIILKDTAFGTHQWLWDYYTKLSTTIQKTFQKQFNIELKINQRESKNEDWLIISAI